MRRNTSITFALMLLLAGCACQSRPVAPEPIRQPALHLKKREPNLTQRLLEILSPSQPKETMLSGS